mmetsp:Transcript_144944/g.449949  ORF Transcript_144944/g.449949 Transcript_144944/m.449949 type:complete len:286 (-) Transcript_144944:90-947(-)
MAAYSDYKQLTVELRESGVCIATISGDHPSGTNLMTMGLFGELDRFTLQVEKDDAVRVLVMRSANPEFWIPHFDVGEIIATKVDKPAKRFDKVRGIQALCQRVHTMGKPTIAEVVGRVGGGGCELASGFDMRFGVLGRTVVSNQEVGLGVLAGGSSTVRWPKLVGRGRALEVLLGCVELDASTAEQWGWLNRAFPSAESCSAYVDWLAERLAGLPREALRLTKRSVDYSLARPQEMDDALCEEQYLFHQLLRLPEAQRLLRRFMERGGQTKAVESRPDALLASKL